MGDRNWKLSPSDFAFLWEECKRCFYLKVVKGFFRPPPIFPRIFNIIDSQMKMCFAGQRLENLVKEIPKGLVTHSDEWVESIPIAFPNYSSTCFIRGKFDTIVKFDDNTYGVIDFKTSEINENHINLYSRQLHAYAYALENPAPSKFSCSPISKLGLIVYEPKEFSCNDMDIASLKGGLKWLEIPRNNDAFLGFLHDVLTLLDKQEPPSPSPTCEWCKYRDNSRVKGY